MSKRDYYEVLGLAKESTEEDIKKAYRRLAMKHHPDRVSPEHAKESEEKFKEVKEAYEHLSDENKRAAYDRFGHSSNSSHGAGPQTWTFEQGGFDDIFQNIFKNHPGFDGTIFEQRARQQISVLHISLEDAYKGTTLNIDPIHTVTVPPGVRSGTRFYVDNKLYRIDIHQHSKFKRANDDLLVDIEINAIEAMLGVEAILNHLDNAKLQFNIPSGIQSGQVIRLTNKGMKNPETDRFGDMMIRVSINIPKILSEEQKTALRAFNQRTTINI